MNIPAAMAYLKSCSRVSEGELRLSSFSWLKFADAAGVSPLEDTTAFRVLKEKGLIEFHQWPGTYGDGHYTFPRKEAPMQGSS